MKWYLLAVAAVHAAFMLCELFPWRFPVLLRIVSKKLPDVRTGDQWTDLQQPLVATIVHNAGIYNGILAGGLLWAALPEIRPQAWRVFPSLALQSPASSALPP
jgi:hypothetical protein